MDGPASDAPRPPRPREAADALDAPDPPDAPGGSVAGAPRWPRAVLVVVVAVVLLALLAGGTSALRPGAGARELVDFGFANPVLAVALAVGAGIAGAVFVPMVLASFPGIGIPGAERSRGRRLRLVAAVGAVFVVGSLLPSIVGRRDAPEPRTVARSGAPAKPAHSERDPGSAGVDAWVIGTAFALGVLGGVIALVRMRRRPDEPDHGDDEAPAEARPRAIDASLEAIASEADPRRAVILAYVRMEDTLRSQGLPRAVWETPHEYLARVFSDLGPRAAAAARLTDLYEEAHFADHRMAEEMRTEAQESLVALRAALGVSA